VHTVITAITWTVAIGVLFAGALWLGWEVYYGYIVPHTTQLASFTVTGLFGFAVLAGIMVNFGPCSLAVLPAYMSYYLSAGANAHRAPLTAGVRAGALASVGVISFYITLGTIIAIVGTEVAQFASQIKLVIAGLILVIGLVMVVCPAWRPGLLERFKYWMQRRSDHAAPASKLGAFGAIYAAGGLSCLFPVFLPLVMYPILSGELIISFASFLFFALAQALFLIAVTIAVAYGRQAIVLKVRGIQQWLPRIAGVLLIVTSGVMVGIYLYVGM